MAEVTERQRKHRAIAIECHILLVDETHWSAHQSVTTEESDVEPNELLDHSVSGDALHEWVSQTWERHLSLGELVEVLVGTGDNL